MSNAIRVSAALILLCLPCVAQFEVRSLAGTVTDKKGNALPGAAVQLEDSRSLAVMSPYHGQGWRLSLQPVEQRHRL